MATRNSRSSFPKLAFTRDGSEQLKALHTKFVADPEATRSGGQQKARGDIQLPRDAFEELSAQAGQESVDADAIFQLLPDVELAKQILVGSILSPKDMTQANLNFTLAEGAFESEAGRALLQVVEDYFKLDYKIDDKLDTMLEEILFTKGAYPLLVLPENNLDMMINGGQKLSVESYRQAVQRTRAGKPLGFLGHPRNTGVSMESFRDRSGSASNVLGKIGEATIQVPGLSVTDNFNLLKTPELKKRGRQRQIGDLLGQNRVSMEAATRGLTPEQIDSLYQREKPNAEPTQVVVPQEYMSRPSIGHPLVMKLPMESVIPVHIPGQPEEHIGYFIMIDPHGRPVVKQEDRDYYGEIRSSFKQNSNSQGSEHSAILKQTRDALNGVNKNGNEDQHVEALHKAYAGIIENDLLNRLQNGIYGEEFEIDFADDVYRIMLWRSLKAKQTQLLYVPVELLTYMAFTYNKNGIGETLLTQSKLLSSMRSVLLFAETMAGVRNAVGRKRASINVDAADPDPQRTISDIQNSILEGAKRAMPIGSPDPARTLDYLNRAGFDFSINVEGENFPTTKVEFDDFTTQSQAGNPELQDRLRRMHISGFGMNPELVDPTQSPDFAVSVVNNNLIMTRRVLRYQKRFTAFTTAFVQTFTQHSSTLKQRLIETLEDNRKKLSPEQKKQTHEEILDDFIRGIETSLPQPDTTRLEQQAQAFEAYSNFIDRALEAYITPDLFPSELVSQEPDVVNQAIAVIRAYYQRLWLEQNNVLPELDQLTEMEDKKHAFNLLDIQQGNIESLGESLIEYFEKMAKLKRNWAAKQDPNDDVPGAEGDETGFAGPDTSGSIVDPLEVPPQAETEPDPYDDSRLNPESDDDNAQDDEEQR